MTTAKTYSGSSKPSVNSRRPSAAIVTIFIFISTVLIALPHFPALWDDSHYYIAMASGNTSEIVKPFSDRILLPSLAAALSKYLHLDLDTGFEILALAGLSIWLSVLVPLWKDFELTSGYLTIFVLLSPIVLIAFETVHIPDMLHMAGTALFFYAVKRGKISLVAFVMCVLMTIRESSIALAAVTIIYFVCHRRFSQAAAVFTATIIGMAIVSHFAEQANNVHDMPSIIYMALKVPANFLHNLFGISLWTDSFQWCDQPVFSFPIPTSINLGKIHQVGFCRPELFQPLLTLASLTAFGILPVILIMAFRGRSWSGLPHHEAWWAIAFWYGGLMTFLGTISGTAVLRLIGYGWPLFLLIVPLLYAGITGRFKFIRFQLLALHIIAMWLPYMILEINWSQIRALGLQNIRFNPALPFISAFICFIANLLAYRIIAASTNLQAAEAVK